MDISDQRRVEQCLRLGPELIPCFSLSLRIGDQRRHKLQDVLLRVNVGEGIIFHRLPEIDRVEDLDDIRCGTANEDFCMKSHRSHRPLHCPEQSAPRAE